MADTGNSATITFATSTFSGSIISIDGNEASIPVLPTDHLGTVGSITKMAGDLIDQGELTLEFFLDPDTQPPMTGVAELVTITFPVPAGGSTGATLAGTAFTSKWKWGTLKNNELVKATMTVVWDGETEPAWTDGT